MKVCLFIFFLLGFHIYAQAQISGKAFVEKDRSPIRGASVMLRNFQTKKILTYTQTDAQGKFSLKKKLDKGVYLIEIRHLSYETFSQSIVVSDSIAAAVHLSAAMKLRQNKLKEVVVKPKTRPPIIVKKDTTIYDIKHWLRESDETLEDVLKKMDGIEISPDGEITVDGQRVKKVLIDGKEVSDVGAAVITKSIDPESVKNIEVRFDEKDDKIKESLLDANEYVVLDIKLKEGFNKRFFGKLRPTLGYQHDLQYGGYANLFSLNNWGNLHLFAEHDNFGTQTLSMTNLKKYR